MLLPFRTAPITLRLSPEEALAAGRWVKWIGGASNQDLASIEDLAGIYTLAGGHCLDLAADPAVVAAARRGISWALGRDPGLAVGGGPWLMVSLSDGADPHFRKAWFDPALCPPGCPRPCARVCPALAIPPTEAGGVLEGRCYGCGRCLPICPLGLIEERHQLLAAEAVVPLLATLRPDAIELHTRIGRATAFAERLAQVVASGVPLRRLAVSCGLEAGAGDTAGEASPVRMAAELHQRHAALHSSGLAPIWQLDGRPMSGDVGAGTAQAAVDLLRRVAPLAPPGPIQLAGGTNGHTLALVERLGPQQRRQVAGVAFGSVARRQLQPLLQEASARGGSRLLDQPDLWPRALAIARALVDPWLVRTPLAPPGQ